MGKIFEKWNKGGNQEELKEQERNKKKNPGNNGMKLVQRDREEGTGEEGVQICTSR